MSCAGSLTTIGSLSGAGTDLTMAEATTTTVSRRSTRIWAKDGDSVEMMPPGMMTYEPKYGSSSSDEDKEMPLREKGSVMSTVEPRTSTVVDLGIDLSWLFPSSPEGMGKQVADCLQVANTACKSNVDGRPINFGAVLPGAVYRSSFPIPETLPFLETLGLKTVLSLVDKEFPAEFRDFMTSNGIRHRIVEMQGTKRVAIPDSVMNSIMEIALNKENHPLLIHCNHGKHRTGCAVAVLRHVSGWQVDQIVQEYQGFAAPKSRDCDIKYIKEYKVTKLVSFFRQKGNHSRGSVITSSKMRNLLLASAAAIAIWITTGVLWGEGYL